MSDRHDDTTPPFVGHGFACMSEQYPLDAGSRIQAMERQIDLLTDQMAALAKRIDELSTQLLACREALRECRGFVEDYGNQAVLALIDSLIGPDVLSRIGGERAS